MKKLFILLIITIPVISFGQVSKNIEVVTYTYILDSIKSKVINDSRDIKIYLPSDYSATEKYPIIYTLDGDTLFEITAEQAKQLNEFEVIPKCIVIGIFHKNRNKDLGVFYQTGNYTESSKQFRDFLVSELVPYINSKYSVSGFNVIIGHSNSATFIHNLLLEEKSPFSGFVGLSQSLWGNQLEKFVQLLKDKERRKTFYFVGSGKKDSSDRQASGRQLDTVFNSTLSD